MPFTSESQRKYLWMKHPEVAQEFARKTPKGKTLPKHVKRHAMIHAMKDDHDADDKKGGGA